LLKQTLMLWLRCVDFGFSCVGWFSVTVFYVKGFRKYLCHAIFNLNRLIYISGIICLQLILLLCNLSCLILKLTVEIVYRV